jgi:predicted phosphatase
MVMLFRLINILATFQRYINNVILLYLYNFTITYLDDILIFFNNIEEHIWHVKIVL